MQELLNKWNIKIDYNILLSMWNEPHRYYHNQQHLIELIEKINSIKKTLSEKEYDKLILCALFHDIVYQPNYTDNEERSANFFLSCCQDKDNVDILEIYNMIIETKTHKSTDKLSVIFNNFDMDIVESDYDKLLEWEMGIRNEFVPHYGVELYKNGRLSFLNSLLDKYPNNTENLLKLIDYIKNNDINSEKN